MHKSPRLIPYIFRPRLPLLCSHSQLQNNIASFPPSTAKALYPPIGDGPTPLLASTAGMRGQRGEESSASYLHSTGCWRGGTDLPSSAWQRRVYYLLNHARLHHTNTFRRSFVPTTTLPNIHAAGQNRTVAHFGAN